MPVTGNRATTGRCIGYRRDDRDGRPARTCTRTTSPRGTRGAEAPADPAAAHAHRDHRAGLGARAGRRARPRPHPPARRRAARRADHRARAACSTATAGRCRNTLVEIWQANAAGRYAHDGRPPPGAARPQLHRRRPLRDRRRGPLPVRHDQARRLPVANNHATPGARRTSTSRCSARRSRPRLVTQMYFPGDPLFAQDPIFNSVRDERTASA